MFKDCNRFGVNVAARWTLALLSGTLLVVPHALRAQTPTQGTPQHQKPLPKPGAPIGAEQPKFKGIWEPVNYTQDMKLTDVFFVTPDVGYVSGYSGTILKTVDGGRTWTAQLGGDPQSQEREIRMLHFVDRTHGWALQPGSPAKLLRTTDGENWEQASNVPEAVIDYQFVSPSVGMLLEGNANYSRIYRSVDGGRTWKETLPQSACRFNAQVEGLSRQVGCVLSTLAVASRMEAYAVGSTDLPDMIIVAKTQDGGITWSLTAIHGPSNVFDYYGRQWQRLFFLDSQNGLLATEQDRLYATSDGGASWHGVAGAAGPRIGFADPEVGWAFKHLNFGFDYVLRYTTDGGKRWLSRSLHFPAEVAAFTLPRRNAGYVVGNHGMIYRYRVVPVNYQAAAHSIDAPAMPGFDSPVFGEVATLNDVVSKLRSKVPAVAAAPGQSAIQSGAQPGGQIASQAGSQASTQPSAQTAAFLQDTSTPSSTVPGAAPAGTAGGFQQDTGSGPVPGGYMDSCCGPLVQQLETTANSFATNVPAFSQRFRNLNLILEGLNLVNNIVGQANTLKQSIRALRQAKNAQGAALALTAVQTQVNGISSSGGFVQDTTLPSQP